MKQKILFVISLLFGLLFINAGLNKFLNYMPMPDDLPEKMVLTMNAFLEIGWLIPLVGFVEIIGGILCMIPRYRALGALIIFPIMIGILFTNMYAAPSGMPLVLILLTINLWFIFENKDKFKPIF